MVISRKLLIVMVSLSAVLYVVSDLLHFEHYHVFTVWSLVIEGSMVLMTFLIFVLMQKFEGPRHVYWTLTTGFTILFFATLTDFLDEMVVQPKAWGVYDDVLLLCSMCAIALGIFNWMKYNHRIIKDISKIATTDQLTGVYNRHKLQEVFEHECKFSARYNTPLSVVMMDIDFFKKINDEHGHLTGDDILTSFADIIQNNVRETDHLARVGGEEFVILMPSTTLSDAKKCAEKLRLLVAEAHFEKVEHITVSMGVSIWRVGDGLNEISARVDGALYRAKSAGRNCIVVEE